ncbi:hypothetical protein C6497_10960 [Candidatus Poribacteria bacterium]|nr:MAG: hypothetical protein C6497_10960 [Candidatus Poribacteria bacterium]
MAVGRIRKSYKGIDWTEVIAAWENKLQKPIEMYQMAVSYQQSERFLFKSGMIKRGIAVSCQPSAIR